METSERIVTLVAALTRKFAEIQANSRQQGEFADLSLRQIYYLETIHRLGQPTPTELVAAMQVSKPSVSHAVDKLESQGFVRKVPSSQDRRSYHLHLTAKGKRIARLHEQVHRRMAQLFSEGLDQQELAQLATLIEKALAGASTG